MRLLLLMMQQFYYHYCCMIVRMRMLPQESLSISLTIYYRFTFDIWIRSSHKVSHIMQIAAGEAECGVVWWGREWQLCMRTSGHWPWCHRPQHQPRPANTTRDTVNLWHVRWVHLFIMFIFCYLFADGMSICHYEYLIVNDPRRQIRLFMMVYDHWSCSGTVKRE